MNESQMHRPPPIRSRARGYSLIEVMVALAVALFLLAGIVLVEQGTHQTSLNQSGLANLQDEERTAMTILANVVQQAGYYPTPATLIPPSELLLALPVDGAIQAGQGIYGQTDANGNEILTVRFTTNSGDGVLNCQGSTNTTGPGLEYDNIFAVDTTNHQLTCQVNGGTVVPLINNVQGITVLYGVNSTSIIPFDNSGAVDAYLTSAQVTGNAAGATFWTNIYTVKVTITFINPLAGQPGQPATIAFTRVIGLKARTGVDV
jgi:type IV pilus assembly protein PilW